ncbi:MAG TPA: START domain-containing protein [Smithellaceae bacterium]|nr:START domain-containing protein [Smithellaceae bacterium]
MKHSVAAVFAILFLSVALSGFAAGRYCWESAGTVDGCELFTSAMAGRPYIAAKAVCILPAGADVLGVVLKDIAAYPQWMHDCTQTKVLKVVDDENDVLIFWFRQHIALFSDRDMVLKSKTKSVPEKGQYFVHADSTEELAYNAGKGYVRMPSFHSLFILEWIDRNTTRVTLMIDPDLGEGVPSGPANKTIRITPLKTLKKMEGMAKQKKYLDAAKTSKYAKLVEQFAGAKSR